MATRKKKDPGTLSGLPKDYPYVTVGTHLIVTEYEDGRRELVWDDAALLQEVRAAIAKAESKMPAVHADVEDVPAPRVNSNPPKKPTKKVVVVVDSKKETKAKVATKTTKNPAVKKPRQK